MTNTNQPDFSDDRSHEPNRGRMALARALPMLIFTLCAGAIMTVIAVRNFRTFSGTAVVLDEAVQVCNGIPNPQAAPLTPDVNGINPMVTFNLSANGYLRAANQFTPEGWMPEAVDETEIVLCLSANRTSFRSLCNNSDTNNIYGQEVTAKLYAAQSGILLSEGVIVSNPAAIDECATELPDGDQSENVVTVDHVEEWVRSQLAGK